ncbi:MAG: chalcone isomerase family protein [Burkholderiales bacterium]
MWANTPSWRSSLRRALLAAALVLAAPATALANAGAAPPLPNSVQAIAPNLTAKGGGLLTFLGIAVYDGWYWTSARGWPADGPYALDLVYHRDLDGGKIAQRSVDEIAKLGYGTPEQRARWGSLLAAILPDVRKGDRLTGVHMPDGSVRYFHNGRPIGEVAEPGFARAFFGIWLDPSTSRADFRQKLLGER